MSTSTHHKFGRNAGCPCGSGEKYKNCCLQRAIPWSDIKAQGISSVISHLSARGKNTYFYSVLFDALQIDPERPKPTLEHIKRGFSAQTVQKLYTAVAQLWPTLNDLKRILSDERQRTSGLYVGRYDHSTVAQGVTRYSLYSDTILLLDPFAHPNRFRDEFNPILHPEQH